ncbi:hypothetical protein [Leptospira phage LE3]|uniref:Helix-turn-helix domain-containing protein n=1 Tax=Leptospira phage LE3 TaxID=2041382 RepID=A0A343LEA1_9CAUD|nr:hypothetical protein HWB33_gp65 [Leptospira phage LE3]ATN95011.1 hypothetical protein [Leptospira phage LE3]
MRTKNKFTPGIFGACPIELLQEKGVTLNHIKTFVSIASFQGGNDKAFPTRQQIMERAGIDREGSVSQSITWLVSRGWIIRQRRARTSSIYKISFPGEPISTHYKKRNITESVTSSKDDITLSDTSSPDDVTESVTSNYKTTIKNKTTKESKKQKLQKNPFLPEKIDYKVLLEFIKENNKANFQFNFSVEWKHVKNLQKIYSWETKDILYHLQLLKFYKTKEAYANDWIIKPTTLTAKIIPLVQSKAKEYEQSILDSIPEDERLSKLNEAFK